MRIIYFCLVVLILTGCIGKLNFDHKSEYRLKNPITLKIYPEIIAPNRNEYFSEFIPIIPQNSIQNGIGIEGKINY